MSLSRFGSEHFSVGRKGYIGLNPIVDALPGF
jgi:hypothetical protein